MSRRTGLVAAGVAGLAVALALRYSDQIAWRAKLVGMQMDGELPGIEWSQVIAALAPDRFGVSEEAALARKMATGRFGSIQNPRSSREDMEIGERIFWEQCASCHGLTDGGGIGHDLSSGSFRHGASDWALFQTISRGIPGTAMEAFDASPDSIWRLVVFVRSLAVAGSATDEGAASREPSSGPQVRVPYGRLVDAAENPASWVTYSGTYDGHRYSRLRAIDRSNVHRLVVRWVFQMETVERRVETTPVVVDSVMFVTEPPNNVHALDARTGRVLWSYERAIPERLAVTYGRVNRGLSVLNGSVFLGTLDAHLVALDARTGELLWDVKVANHEEGYTITGAPLAVKDMVVTGMAGGLHGVRGFLDAYDADSGQRRWRFYTVPGPGEPGNETWSGDSWKRGGAATWLTGSYDPDLDLLYWGVGNPGPVFYGEVREGDNLYANSVIALDPDSGRLEWHFQFTPHDVHDWDAAQIPVLVDADFQGEPRKLLLWANRNAFFYVLDRATGEFLRATEFARQNWADSIDSRGRPLPRPGAEPSVEGSLVYPGFLGATNWWSPAWSGSTGYLYVPVRIEPNLFFKSEEPPTYSAGRRYMGGFAQAILDVPPVSVVRAIDYRTGRVVWEYPLPGEAIGGLLATAGHLVFGMAGKSFFALDSESGEELWRFNTGGLAAAAPITYEAGGEQFVAGATGRSLFVFALSREATGPP